jgi:hypothetical protein
MVESKRNSEVTFVTLVNESGLVRIDPPAPVHIALLLEAVATREFARSLPRATEIASTHTVDLAAHYYVCGPDLRTF